MAQQIKKKYLKDGSVDGSKIKILSGQSIVAENASSQLVELLKINASNKVEAVGQEISYKSELDQEVLDRQSGDSQNSAGLAQEILDRQAAVSAEQSRAEGEENLLKSRVTTAEGDIDSLEGRMMTAESNISNEVSRATSEENLIKSRVTTAEGDIDSLESRMMTAESNISNEVSRAEGEENLLKGRMTTAEGDIDSLESRMMSAESNISNEVSRAEGEENLLKGRMTTAEGDIDSLEGRMMSAEGNISNEVSRATSEENLLKGRMTTAEGDIDSLESRMMSAESGLSTETADRIAGDANLQSQINNVLSNIDPVALDSLTEVVAAFQSADSDLTAAITALGTSAQSALAQEILDRQADVDAEETRAMGVEADLQSQITQEISDRQSAVSSEQSRAEGVEAGLQSAIDAEVLARQSAVSSEEARAMAAESDLHSAVDIEEFNRIAAVSAEAQARSDEDLTFFKLDGSREVTGRINFDLSATDFDLVNSHSEISNSGIEYVRNPSVSGDPSITLSMRRDVGYLNMYNLPDTQVDNGDGTFTTTYDGIFKQAKLSYEDGLNQKITSKSYDGQYETTNQSIIGNGSLQFTQKSVNSDGSGFGDDINTVSIDPYYFSMSRSVGNRYINLGFTDESGIAFMSVRSPNSYIGNDAGSVQLYARFNDNGGAGILNLIADSHIELTSQTKTMNPVVLYAESYDEEGNFVGVVPAVPTDAKEAVNKAYVDSQVSSSGSTNLVEAKAYADQKVADLVNSAPEVLDTLKELSDALGGDANFAASVASTIGDVSSRVSVVESIANGKHKVVLSSTDISNGYIDLPHNARVESMMGFVDRLAIHNEEDYTVSVVGGVTRITFTGELVSPSEQALVVGDTIFFRYEFYSA